MEGKTPTIENNEMYSKEEFVKKFNNFHLVFTVRDPEYLPDIKEFLKSHFFDKFEEIKKDFQERTLSRRKIADKHINTFYEIYTVLKREGFSNKDLGLFYG